MPACLSELAQGDERLERVRPGRDRGVVPAGCDEPLRQLAQVAGGGLHVAERELETAEHAERVDRPDLVRARLRPGEPVLGPVARLLDEAEVSLDQRRHAARPCPSLLKLGLVGELVCSVSALECQLQVAGEPLELARATRESAPA